MPVNVSNVYNRNANSNEPERDIVAEQSMREINTKLVGIDLQTDLFANITFPSLPKNFEMLMSKIDWPKKAMVNNTNGSLFADPQEIDKSPADDIALQCFGGDLDAKGTLNPSAHTSEAYEYQKLVDLINKTLNEDTDNGHGSNIKPASTISRNEKMVNVNMTVVNAITNYIDRSLNVIHPLLQMVAGDAAKESLSKVNKIIKTANQTSTDTIKEWLKAHSAIDKDTREAEKDSKIKELHNALDYRESAQNVYSCIAISASDSTRAQYLSDASRILLLIETQKDLDKFVLKFCADYYNFKQFDADWNNGQNRRSPFKINLNPLPQRRTDNNDEQTNEYVMYKGKNMLVEDVINGIFEADDDEETTTRQNPNAPSINYDSVYQELLAALSSAITEAIGPRANWTVMKNIAEEMKILKDRVDEEIKKKIAIVCKTDGQKSLLHHPYKAEGLLSMWSRYSSELQLRIQNRIDLLTGTNGGVESGSANMVEDFLTVTYPQIIAAMLTYRCVFQQIAYQYKNGMIPQYTLEDFEQIREERDDYFDTRIEDLLISYDNAASSPL